ncbi:alpha/beta-hydrolase [Paramyrothecium foliicola]|nr:alpha/beta-hydrolase [Paramyrothecium foliicola]
MESIKPFKINVPEADLERLKQKLSLTDFPSEPVGIDPWSQGPPVSDIKRLVHVWENEFDWREVERKLNELPQFTAEIDVEGHGMQTMHFIHHRSTTPNAIPLLFLHGWPGSFLEVTKLLPLLVKGGIDYPAFHVVAPSLIDFGFSSGSLKKGFNIDQQAEACHKLMQELGYTQYVAQGGDIGAILCRLLAKYYGPVFCKAYHINNASGKEPTEAEFPKLYAQAKATPLTDREKQRLTRSEKFQKDGASYYMMQATRPLTIAYSLASSPVGLLTWIYEKIHDWSGADSWTDTEVLTWISVYYFSTAGAASSVKIYAEFHHRQPTAFEELVIFNPNVRIGVSHFPFDILATPKLWDHTLGPIAFQAEHSEGGHFAAWECPNLLAEDLRTMFGKGGGCYACVEDKDGYEGEA